MTGEPAHVATTAPNDDPDLELALALHRELNAPTRRVRGRDEAPEPRKRAPKKPRQEEELSSFSAEAAVKVEEKSEEEEQLEVTKKKSRPATPKSPKSPPLAIMSLAVEERKAEDENDEASRGATGEEDPAKKSNDESKPQRRPGRPPNRKRLPPAVRAATAERKKATAAREIDENQCRCFLAGVKMSVLLPNSTLTSRSSLLEAAKKAIGSDAGSCSLSTTHIVTLAADGLATDFPPPDKNVDNKDSAWKETGKAAVRVYLRVI